VNLAPLVTGVSAINLLYAAVPSASFRRRAIEKELRMLKIDAGVHPQSQALSDGPAILVCNHLHSVLDVMLVKLLDPDCWVVMKSDVISEAPPLLRGPLTAFLQTSLKVLYLTRDGHGRGHDPTIRDRVTAVLRRGGKVLVFAEGRTQRDGPPRTMFHGSLKIAADVGCPVVPVAVGYRPAVGWEEGSALRNVLEVVQRDGGVRARIMCGEAMAPVKPGEGIERRIEFVRCAVEAAYLRCVEEFPDGRAKL